MKKKILDVLFLVCCILFCFSIGISAFFSNADAGFEQRELSAFPSFVSEDGKMNKNFDSELSDYLAERMPFRTFAVKAKAFAAEKIFRTSAQEKVIVGKNGQYYFNETVDEYCGRELLSARSIHNVIDTLEQINQYCQSRSIRFVFAVAPNKNTLYGQDMPLRYLKGETSNYDRLAEALRTSDVPHVDFHDLAQMSDLPLYYKTDTHWNMQGALIAYNALMSSLNIEHADYAEIGWRDREKVGDLMKMLYPVDPNAETELVPDFDFAYEYTSRFKSEEDIKITTHRDGGSGSLLMFRDSFGNALLPYFAEHFENATFSRAVPCDLVSAEEIAADTVIYEIVQRNIKNIISYAPILPAQKCDILPNTVLQAEPVHINVQDGELIRFYGEIDPALLTDSADIYVCLTNASGQKICFRSFCIGEVDSSALRDNGFSCRIAKAELPEQTYAVSLCVSSENGISEIKTDFILQLSE